MGCGASTNKTRTAPEILYSEVGVPADELTRAAPTGDELGVSTFSACSAVPDATPTTAATVGSAHPEPQAQETAVTTTAQAKAGDEQDYHSDSLNARQALWNRELHVASDKYKGCAEQKNWGQSSLQVTGNLPNDVRHEVSCRMSTTYFCAIESNSRFSFCLWLLSLLSHNSLRHQI